MRRRTRSQRGAASVEAVLLVPALVMLLCLTVAGWRVWGTRSAVTQAAAAGARAGTLAPSGGQARSSAEAVARANLATLGTPCPDAAVQVDAGDFALPPGVAGEVRVAIDCSVDLADLLVPGLPGRMAVRSQASEKLDTFRERTP